MHVDYQQPAPSKSITSQNGGGNKKEEVTKVSLTR